MIGPRAARAAALLTAAALVGAVLPASAGAAERSGAQRPRTVSFDLTVKRFTVVRGRTMADATATTRVLTRDGKVRERRRRTLLAVAGTPNCRVLTLRLDDLKLELLGLELNTSAVNLRITGDPSRTLGRLFCRLAGELRLRSLSGQRALSRSLNRRLGARGMRVLQVRAAVAPREAKQQQGSASAARCEVLRLVLGPLRLDLLGLVVDLYGGDRTRPVEIELTADPNGGVLGSLFCQLARSEVTLRAPQ